MSPNLEYFSFSLKELISMLLGLDFTINILYEYSDGSSLLTVI